MNKQILIISFMLFSLVSMAQVGIGNTNPKATLDVTGVTAAAIPSGILVPRFTQAELAAKDAAYLLDQNGVLVFVSAVSVQSGKTSNITAVGFHYYNHATLKWVAVTPAAAAASSVVTVTTATYTILGTEDIILADSAAAATFTLPATAAIGKRIVIANKSGVGGGVSIAVASPGVFWNGSGFGTTRGNSNVFTYTASGWINEAIGLN